MRLRGIVDEDIVNYNKTSMFLIFPDCSFKCNKECGNDICQNSSIAKQPIVDISKEAVCERYLKNPLTEAIVCGGLEPFDSVFDLLPFIDCLRRKYNCNDDIVIYTGYTEEELEEGYRTYNSGAEVMKDYWRLLKRYGNIIVKFGRFIPDQQSHFDEVLGVNLASPNQYAKRFNGEDNGN